MQFILYPKCSTCQKAKKYLDNNNISYEERNIITETPSSSELKQWKEQFNIPIRKLFNTSGNKYKELHLKDNLANMSEEEIYSLLSSDGMLIKRPLVVSNDFILIGFKENEWEQLKASSI